MIRINRVTAAPQSLIIEKNKNNGSYKTPEVVKALHKDFHNKCYICESKNLESINIEHFRPHGGDKKLMFSWENLFLSCGHCNNTKLGKYNNILDCTKVDVDEVISFRKKGTYGWEETIEIKALVEGEDKRDAKDLIIRHLKATSPFAAFKRWIIRDNKNNLAEFLDCDGIKCIM